MINYRIALRVSARTYSKLVDLGNRVHVSMTGNANFATPAVPLPALLAAIEAVAAALALWGLVGNRGSHAAFLDLKQKALVLKSLLVAQAGYVEATAIVAGGGTDTVLIAAIIESSGYAFGYPKTPVGLLEQVQNFRNIKDRGLDANKFRSRWNRPLNTRTAHDVDAYEIWRGTTPDFAQAEHIGSTSATTFTDTNPSAGAGVFFYFVRPVGASGVGAVSDPLMVRYAA